MLQPEKAADKKRRRKPRKKKIAHEDGGEANGTAAVQPPVSESPD
jgi:hypothetical protein